MNLVMHWCISTSEPGTEQPHTQVLGGQGENEPGNLLSRDYPLLLNRCREGNT